MHRVALNYNKSSASEHVEWESDAVLCRKDEYSVHWELPLAQALADNETNGQ